MNSYSYLLAKLLCIFTLIALTACTTKNFYDAVQENRLRECNKLQGVRQAECIDQYNKTYKEYTDAKEKKSVPVFPPEKD